MTNEHLTDEMESTGDGEAVGLPQPVARTTTAPAPALNPFELPETLPADYKGAYDFLQKFLAIPAQTEQQAEWRGEALERLGAHCHAVQQQATIHHIVSRPICDQERHQGRPQTRGATLEAIKAALSSGELKTTPAEVGPFADLRISEAVFSNDVKNLMPGALKLARTAIVEYAKAFHENYSKMFYEDRVGEIKVALVDLNRLQPEQVDALHAELQRLESGAAEFVRDSARQVVFEKWQPVKQLAVFLLNNLADVLESQQKKVIESERTFLGCWGQSWEPTAASRQFNARIKSARDSAARLANENGLVSRNHVPLPEQNPISSTFALKVPGL